MSEEEAEAQESEKEERWIEDQAGHSYRLTISDVQDLWVLEVCDVRAFVGQSNCLRKNQELLLRDLRISNDVIIPE